MSEHDPQPTASSSDVISNERARKLLSETIANSNQASVLWGLSGGISLGTFVISLCTDNAFTAVAAALMGGASAWNVAASREAARKAREWRAYYDRP